MAAKVARDVPTTGMHIAMIQLTRVSDAMNQDRLGTATAFIAISKAAITASEATALLARLWALWLAARLEIIAPGSSKTLGALVRAAARSPAGAIDRNNVRCE
jgi:hypothetical protein